jgi:hypothetical protein
MENIISRSEFALACDHVDAVSGTVTVKRCVEDGAARLFPNENYLDYLDWIDDLNREGLSEDAQDELPPIARFEKAVSDVYKRLEKDGSLYLEDYRMFVSEKFQILYALNIHYGMSWVFINHVVEAIARKRQRKHKNI